jgi:hypothetical protein
MATGSGRVHENFGPGRLSDLKAIIAVKGTRRTMHFYPTNRPDGMIKRELIVKKKVCRACLRGDHFR